MSQRRDGVFKKNGAYWIDFVDADGKRRRKKAAPTYALAKLIYRDTVTAIAKGEVLGVRDEGIPLARFIEKHYWPAVAQRWSAAERDRARVILDRQILPRFGARRMARIEAQDIQGWQTERLAHASPGTANKELMRFKHVLNRAVEWGYLRNNPAARVKKLRDAPGRMRYLQPEERAALLAEAPA